MRRNGQLRLLIFGAIFVVLVVGLSVALRFAGGVDQDAAAPVNQPEAVVTETDNLDVSKAAPPKPPVIDTSGLSGSTGVADQRSSSQGMTSSQGDTLSQTAPALPATDSSSLSESVEVAVQRSPSRGAVASQNDASSPAAPELQAADTSTLSESADVAVQRAASESGQTSQDEGPSQTVPALLVADTSSLSESADVQIQRSEPAPAVGGRGELIGVQESVEFIIRDSSGNIKRQGVAK